VQNSGKISNCYFSGIVSGQSGSFVANGTSINNYYDKEICSATDVKGGVGKTTVEMNLIRARIIVTDEIYTGNPIKPAPSVMLDGVAKVEGVDFDFEYGENINAGTGSVTIIGKTETFVGERVITFQIKKVQIPKPKLVESSFTYDATQKNVSTDLDPAENYFTFGGSIANTDAGSYTATAILKDTANYEWSDGKTAAISLAWKIDKAPSTDCKVTITDFTASGTPSNPVPSSPNGTYDVSLVSYRYKSLYDNSYPETSQRPANAGSYQVTATFPTNANYLECKDSTAFSIIEGDYTPIYVIWQPGCDKTFEYNGKEPVFTASTAENYPLSISAIQKDAGTYTAKATLVTPIQGKYLESSTASCSYTIAPKTLQVSWTIDSVFTYNKMTQAPTPSINEPGIELLRSNAHSAAGIYKGDNAAYAIIKDEAQRRNYTLTNNTKNYEIKKKDLKPYFDAPPALSNIESNTDTLWVPSSIFKDKDLLQQVLGNLLSYDGFAQDTVTKEKDDASVLKNTPSINLIYASPQAQKMLSKRVETSQSAVAIINTDGVSADNYALARRSVTVMEILDDDEGTKRVLCYRGNYCTELSEDVCTFIKGEAVASCSNIRKSCQIDENLCIDNMFVSECNGIGGTALSVSCAEYTPIKRPSIASGAFRVWQTASGVVNVDLGYMPMEPVAVKVYSLQGKLIASEYARTRFATIKLNVGSGIYLFKVGKRYLTVPYTANS